MRDMVVVMDDFEFTSCGYVRWWIYALKHVMGRFKFLLIR